MMKLPVPELDHSHVYTLAREKFVDASYQKRLTDGQPHVMALGDAYLASANAGLLHTVQGNPAVPPHIIDGDLQKLYKSGLLRKNSEARRIYEKLRVSSPSRVCPFCLHRIVKTLDHYLPKQKYGAYSVLPVNMVPCCRDCNSEKDEAAASDRATSLLHPYFDNVDAAQWLNCEFDITDGYCTPTFFINAQNVKSELLPRLIAHMEKLDLFDLYDVEGAREVNDMYDTLCDTSESSGPDGVQKLCLSMARSRARLAQNYWRAVLWRAAASSDTFVDMQWSVD